MKKIPDVLRGIMLIMLLTAHATYSHSAVQQPGHIAYLRLTDGYWQVWIMDKHGDNQQQLTTSPVDKVHVDWGPENRQLLYHTNVGETFIYSFTANSKRKILKNLVVKDAAWSKSGNMLAYGVEPENLVSGKLSLWVSDLDGKQRQKIAGDAGSDASSPMWYDDDKQLVFRQCVMASNMEVHHDFWRGDVQTGGLSFIGGDSEYLKFDQAVSVKGDVAYSSARSGFYEIWVIPVEGGKPEQLTATNRYAGSPDWSPDGRYLAFDSSQDGGQRIYILDTESHKQIVLTDAGYMARKPVWSN